MNNKPDYNTLSGDKKIALQFVKLLFVCSCGLFILWLVVLSSYETSVDYRDTSFENEVCVNIYVKDKLTGGELAFDMTDQYFSKQYNPKNTYREYSNDGNHYNADVLLTEENLMLQQKHAIQKYKARGYANLGLWGIIIACIWYVRKWMRKKFYNLK